MLIRRVQQVGDSRNINIPAHVCALLGIDKGDSLSIEVENRKIVFAPVTVAKHEQVQASTLKEMPT